MANPRFTSFDELRKLMDGSQKIECIKIIRAITGEGLREAKDFVEIEWLPFVNNGQKPEKTITATQTLMDRITKLEADVAYLQRQSQPKVNASDIFSTRSKGE